MRCIDQAFHGTGNAFEAMIEIDALSQETMSEKA
jgi:hypothetical protein